MRNIWDSRSYRIRRWKREFFPLALLRAAQCFCREIRIDRRDSPHELASRAVLIDLGNLSFVVRALFLPAKALLITDVVLATLRDESNRWFAVSFALARTVSHSSRCRVRRRICALLRVIAQMVYRFAKVGISWSIQRAIHPAHNIFCAAFGWPTPPRRKLEGISSNAALSQFA